MNFDMFPLLLSIKISLLTTLVLLSLGLPLAWVLVRLKMNFVKMPLRIIINLPLVVPPTVLGFYFLVALGPSSFIGKLVESFFYVKLIFTLEGLIVGSILFSFPFMINPIIASMEMIPNNLIEASYLLGKSKLETFIRIVTPNCLPGIISGIVMTFLHTMGEFGLVLMIGGKIPGKTLTASMAIVDYVESFQYSSAHFYSLTILIFSIVILSILVIVNNRFRTE